MRPTGTAEESIIVMSAHQRAVLVLASALEDLAARVSQELDVEVREGAPPDDPYWASAIDGVVRQAEVALQALDEPVVVAALGQ